MVARVDPSDWLFLLDRDVVEPHGFGPVDLHLNHVLLLVERDLRERRHLADGFILVRRLVFYFGFYLKQKLDRTVAENRCGHFLWPSSRISARCFFFNIHL